MTCSMPEQSAGDPKDDFLEVRLSETSWIAGRTCRVEFETHKLLGGIDRKLKYMSRLNSGRSTDGPCLTES